MKQLLLSFSLASVIAAKITFAAQPTDGTYYCAPNFFCRLTDLDNGESLCREKSSIEPRKLVLKGNNLEISFNRVDENTGEKKMRSIKVEIFNRNERSVFYRHKQAEASDDYFYESIWYGTFDGSFLNIAGAIINDIFVSASQGQFKCELF